MELKHLTDAVLLARLQALVTQERIAVADIIEHLIEVDRREIVVDAGYSTLFDYCVKALGYSEAAAFLRIRATRAAAAYPRVLTDLRSGTIHLDAIMRLYPHLNTANSDKLLDQASGATKREVVALVAALDSSATAPERDVIRRLPPTSHQTPSTTPRDPVLPAALVRQENFTQAEPASAPAETAHPQIISPPTRVRLAFTANDDLLLKIERLRGLRRHKFPTGRLEDLLNEAIDHFLNKIDPARDTGRAASHPPSKPNRHIPATVKRLAWKRDEGRCAYVADDGRRCESREFLEYDHVIPWALGGRSDRVENIRLLCRPHNQRLAKRRFGPRRRADADLVRPDAVGQRSDPARLTDDGKAQRKP